MIDDIRAQIANYLTSEKRESLIVEIGGVWPDGTSIRPRLLSVSSKLVYRYQLNRTQALKFMKQL